MDLYIIEPDLDLDIEMTNTQPEAPMPLGDGVTVIWRVPMAKAAWVPKAIEIAFQVLEAVPAGVAANLITGWVMNRFKGKAQRIVVERQEVEFDEGKLKRIVLEKITRERDG